MAQTTGAVTGAASTISVKINAAATFTDISGSTQSIDAPTSTRITGEAYTLEGDIALTTVGKREPVEVTVNVIYTEVSTEAFLLLQDAFVNNHTCQLKWLPKGTGSGNDDYTTATDSRITSLQYAPIDASGAGPIMCQFVVRSSAITYTANT